MRKCLKLFMLLITLVILIGCSTKKTENNTLNIAVSILPEAAFVEAILGDKGTVTTVIPPGFSPANFQPSPNELSTISNANLYFSIGVSAEKNILPKIVTNKTKVVSLIEAVDNKYPLLSIEAHSHEHEAEHDATLEDSNIAEHTEDIDPHIWLSPKRVMVIVETIRDSLTNLDPKNSDYYSTNAEKYLKELEVLDNYISNFLKESNLESFIIYHPSLGYFANDYGLNMLAIEEDGKKATINTIKNVIDFARKNNINVIFYQEEFDSKQARVIADEINGSVVALDILSKDYINNMKKIIDAFITPY